MNEQSPNSSEQRLNVDRATIENSLIGQSERDIFQHSVVTFNHTEIIQSSVEDIKIRKFIKTSPYKGLNKFDCEDKDLFFGRDQFLTSLVNELEQTNLILLLGASGSGKSSVVRAGLIPWLSQKWGTHFVKLMFTPDSDPFAKLYASLQDKYNQTETQIAREAKEDTLSLVVKKLKKSDDYWLIFIDQFEELFTTSLYEKRNLFIKSLVQLNTTEQNSVKIIATMRADFLDRLSPYPELVKATDKHRPMIAEMQVDELRLAIEQPATHNGVVFEQGLVSEIIKDIQGQAGYLPLLQYTLNLLWETEVKNNDFSQNRTLKISTYRQLGGVQGALQKHIDAIYGALSDDEKRATQKIFLKLVDIGEDTESNDEWKAVRKRAPKSAFTTELEQQLLTKLINENLLVSDRTSEFEEATIDITHEILLISWPKLNDWIKENRQALAIRSRLNHDMNLWKTNKSEDELWTGSKLEQVLELRRDQTFNQVLGGFSQDENQFIDVSGGLRDKRRGKTIIALAGFSILAVLLTGFAVTQWYKAELNTKRAKQSEITAKESAEVAKVEKEKAQKAEIDALSKYAYGLAKDKKHFDALLQSLKLAIPLQRDKKDIPMQLRAALDSTVNQVNEKRLEGHHSEVLSVAFSKYSDKIVSADAEGNIKLWDVEKETSDDLENGTLVNTVAFGKDEKIFASGDGNGTIKLWNSESRKIFNSLQDNYPVYTLAFSPDGETLASAGYEGNVKLWHFKTGKETYKTLTYEKYEDYTISKIEFSSDGQTLAAGSSDGTIKIWDLKKETGTPKTLVHGNSVFSITFSSDSQTLASAGYDGIVKLWDVQKLNSLGLWNYGGPVYSIQFSPTGKTLASGSWEGTVKLWNLNTDKSSSNSLNNYGAEILGISYDGQTVAEGLNENESIELRNIDSGRKTKLLTTKDSPKFDHIVFSPNGKTIASWFGGKADNDSDNVDHDNTIQLWDVETRQTKPKKYNSDKNSQKIESLAFSYNDEKIAYGDTNGIIKIEDLKTNQEQSLDNKSEKINSLVFHPKDDKILAVVSSDESIKLWDLTTKKDSIVKPAKKNIEENEDNSEEKPISIAFSPDGKIIAFSNQGDIILKNIKDKTNITTLHNKTWVYSLAFIDDNTLASGGWNGTIKLWDITNPQNTQEIAMLSWPGDVDSRVKRIFSSANNSIIAVNDSEEIYKWDFNSKNLIEKGCEWMRSYLKSSPNVSKDDKNLCDEVSKPKPDKQ